jgi:hypothetical protein
MSNVVFTDLSFPSTAWLAFLIGWVIILMGIRYIQASLQRSRREKSIPFESPEGKVSITLFALEDMLKKMLEERKEVSHIKPKVFLRKNGRIIEVFARGVLMTEVNLVEFIREIQEKVKEKMDVLLGEDRQVRVNLEIRKVNLGEIKETTEEQEPEIPFRNYE